MKSVSKVLLYLFISILFSLNTFGAGSLSACGTANSAGLWTIEDDISDGATATCIDITVDDVILDCQGHWINSTDNSVGNYGIYGTGLDNITIQNCKLSNWGNSGIETGLSLLSGTNFLVRNIVLENNYLGANLDVDDSIIKNITIDNSINDGLVFPSSSRNQVSDIISNNNGDSGISFGSGTSDNNFENLILTYNTLYGLDISTTNIFRNNFSNFNFSYNGVYGYRFGSLEYDYNIFKDGFIYSNTGDNIYFGGFSNNNNLFEYVYFENATEITGGATSWVGQITFDNMFWDNISLFDPCDETSTTYDVCDNNPKAYVTQSQQLLIQMTEYADETVYYNPIETATGQYAGTNENFSHYNITGYITVTNTNPNSDTISNIYLNFDHTTNITLPTPFSGRTGTWVSSDPSSNYLRLHIPELRGGENLTYFYSVNTTNVRPPLNVTSNYSDTKLLAGQNITIQDTLSNNFKAASYQNDVCIREIIFNQSASSINFSGTFYDFTFNPNGVIGTDSSHVTTSSDNLTQIWDVFNGGCLYNNNNPYISYNLSTPLNIPQSQAYDAINTTITYTIDSTLSQLRLTSIRAIGQEELSIEKQILGPSDPFLYGSNVTWNVTGNFSSESNITYDLEKISFWVSQRNYNGSYTDPSSYDNDSLSGNKLNLTYYPNNLSNTLNPWLTTNWLFNYSDVPSPVVWMDINLTIRNDNRQLINRSFTQNGNNYFIKEIYLNIGYWLVVEKNISLIAPDTYQIKIDVQNKGNQVTPANSIVSIYDFVPSNFNISSGFVYSSSSWYNTTRSNNTVSGNYDGTLQQWAIIPSNSLNTSFAQGPSKNANTTWSVTFNATGIGDYTLIDIFITGLDPQKVDGAGSSRAIIVGEVIDKLESFEGISAIIAGVIIFLIFIF